MAVIKIIELIGTSDKSFEDAVAQVEERARKTIRNVKGIHIIDQKAHCGKNGKIQEYRSVCKVAFLLE